MLFILALLFFPCAVVGAFVTADDHDLTAFQSGGFFPEHPIGEAGPLCRRHDAAAKSIVPARRPMSSTCTCTTQRQRSSSVASKMLINSPDSLPSARLPGSGKMEDASATPSPSPDGLHLSAAGGSGNRDMQRRAGHRRARTPTCTDNSDLARCTMPMPSRQPPLSVDILREAYGSRPNFWGDLSAREAREFYKELLAEIIRLQELAQGTDRSSLLVADGEKGEDCDIEALEELARLASMARRAARLYTRERCVWFPRFIAYLYDGVRHMWNYGSFRMTGITWEELCAKYEAQVLEEEPDVVVEELKQRVYFRILEKSCCTSEMFDKLVGLTHETCGEAERPSTTGSALQPSRRESRTAAGHDLVSTKVREDASSTTMMKDPAASPDERRVKKRTRWISFVSRSKAVGKRRMNHHSRRTQRRSRVSDRGSRPRE